MFWGVFGCSRTLQIKPDVPVVADVMMSFSFNSSVCETPVVTSICIKVKTISQTPGYSLYFVFTSHCFRAKGKLTEEEAPPK